MRYSEDYHDYVFKNGKLVGKFDEMYRYSKEVPWHQDKTSHGVFADIDLAILKQNTYRSICDIGCGLGYFTNRLSRELAVDRVTGIDVSRAAVTSARKSFPHCCFIARDLTRDHPGKSDLYDLVVVKEVLWYVTGHLERFFANVMDLIDMDGYLYISQAFPECKKWVGQEAIDSPETLRKIVSKKIDVSYCCIEWDWERNGRPLVHILGRKRQGKTR